MYLNEANGDELLRSALLIRARNGSGVSNSELSYLIGCASKGQIFLVTSEKNELIGYIAYAKVTKFTLLMISRNAEMFLRREELSEGHLTVILDLTVSKDHALETLFKMKTMIKKNRIVAGHRNGKFRILKRGKYSHKRVALQLQVSNSPNFMAKEYFKLCSHQ